MACSQWTMVVYTVQEGVTTSLLKKRACATTPTGRENFGESQKER